MATRKKLRKKVVRHRLLKTDAQRKNAYLRIISDELKSMDLHKLFLARQAVAKITFG